MNGNQIRVTANICAPLYSVPRYTDLRSYVLPKGLTAIGTPGVEPGSPSGGKGAAIMCSAPQY